jgi:hypothetical protein
MAQTVVGLDYKTAHATQHLSATTGRALLFGQIGAFVLASEDLDALGEDLELEVRRRQSRSSILRSAVSQHRAVRALGR